MNGQQQPVKPVQQMPAPKRLKPSMFPIANNDAVKIAIGTLSNKYRKIYRTKIVRSIWNFSTGAKDFLFFSGAEATAVKGYANYPLQGLISTPTGMLVSVYAEILGPDLAAVNYAAGTAPYDVHKEVSRLINSVGLVYEKDNQKRKDILLSEIHEPLFTLIAPTAIGTPNNLYQPFFALQNKTEGKKSVNLFSELTKQSSTVIKAQIPTTGAGISADLNLHNMVLYAVIAEEDT